MTEQVISVTILVFFILLALIGVVEFIIRQVSKKKEADQPAQTLPAAMSEPPSLEGDLQPVGVEPPPVAAIPSASAPPSGSREMEIVRLRRDPSGNLVIEMDGQIYRTLAELNSDRRKRLLSALHDLQDWLTPKAAPADVILPVEPAPLPTPAPAIQKPSRQLGLFGILERALETDLRKAPSVPESVAVQVDVIVQRMVHGTPLAGRGIRLTEMPDHSMAVHVGLERYDGVDVVPDEEIRAVIKAAVAEWANQYMK